MKLGLLGATGRMGREVRALVSEPGAELAGQFTLEAHAGKSALDAAKFLGCDLVIDFSLPEGMLALAEAALATPADAALPVFVVGSTGWKLDQKKKLDLLATRAPVLMSSNFSLGAQALIQILKSQAPLFEKLGFAPVILETHHKHKKDTPSGTALALQSAIAPSGPGNVTTHCVRAGEIVGEHAVTFYGAGEHVTLAHSAENRAIFARGALTVGAWLHGRRAQTPTGWVAIDQFFSSR